MYFLFLYNNRDKQQKKLKTPTNHQAKQNSPIVNGLRASSKTKIFERGKPSHEQHSYFWSKGSN